MEQDKTNFAQSLMHTIKGNLGTGILAMAASFSHCGLLYSIIGLPLLCLISTYCVHLLVRSSQHLESKMKWLNLEYAELAKGSFKAGPAWMKPYSGLMCQFVDFILVINQLGICCVYVVFMAENIITILTTYQIVVKSQFIFIGLIPFVLLLCYIRTLKRLSYASGFANFFQVIGIAIILQYLIRTLHDGQHKPEMVRPLSEVALGFGAAMFAFEGISVVLPIYTRMKKPEQMGGFCGIINLSYVILLLLYFIMGLVGYLRYGHEARGSITINLPQEVLYDCVRAIFVTALLLTYPLQFYVPFEILWNFMQSKLLSNPKHGDKMVAVQEKDENLKLEYLFRTILVLFTFILAMSVPRLNLMMDLVGSISGTALSIMLPAIIHIAAFWEDTSGPSKVFLVMVDVFLILVGTVASASGSYFSFIAIVNSFNTGTIDPFLVTNNATHLAITPPTI